MNLFNKLVLVSIALPFEKSRIFKICKTYKYKSATPPGNAPDRDGSPGGGVSSCPYPPCHGQPWSVLNCEGARGRLLVPQLLCGDRHHWFVFVLSLEEFYSQQVAPYLDSSGVFSLRLVIHLLFTSQIRPYQHSAISISQILTTSDGAEAVDGRLPLLRGLHLPSHQRPRRPGEVEHWTISKRMQPCNRRPRATSVSATSLPC